MISNSAGPGRETLKLTVSLSYQSLLAKIEKYMLSLSAARTVLCFPSLDFDGIKSYRGAHPPPEGSVISPSASAAQKDLREEHVLRHHREEAH